jgi:hypothetical protein
LLSPLPTFFQRDSKVRGLKSKEFPCQFSPPHDRLGGGFHLHPIDLRQVPFPDPFIVLILAIRPEVRILDEPFGALDAITKEELREELLKPWNTHKCTVLMITQDIDEALFLADRLVMMTNGPAAEIGDVLNFDFPRPRSREDIMEVPRYYELRNNPHDFLYNRFALNEDEA